VLFGDSLREALDRKSLYVLMAVSAAFILACASIAFRPLDERQALQSVADEFPTITRLVPGEGRADQTYEVKFEVSDVRAAREGDTVRHHFRLAAAPAAEAHKLIRHWTALADKKVKSLRDPVPDADAPTDFEQQKRFLRFRFREALIPNLELSPAGDLAWDASLRVAGRRALSGAEEMTLFFGAVRWRPRWPDPVTGQMQYKSSAEVVGVIETVMADGLAGSVGILVAVVVTAGFIPNMLQKGTVDVLLAKPIRRSTLLVYKYLGGCAYVLVNSLFLIGGCWLVLSLRTGHWNGYFPLTILVVTFTFVVIYSVSVLVGVLTRGFAASCFVTLIVWAVCSGLGNLHFTLSGGGVSAGVFSAIRFVYLLLPKTFDLGRLNDQICAKGNLGEAASLSVLSMGPPLETWTVLLTSAAFAVLMIALACVRFSKRDY
jgi:ABC-type transport system involved in multi-copper enzyme maturation permease subunit